MIEIAQEKGYKLGGRYVKIEDTRLFIIERGAGYPILVLHGGPGLDHNMFGDYLDPLASEYRLIFVDQRGQGRSDRAPLAVSRKILPQPARLSASTCSTMVCSVVETRA